MAGPSNPIAIRRSTRYRSWLASSVSRFWRERLTRPGRYVLLGSSVTIVAGSLPMHMVGSSAFAFFVALLGLSLAYSAVYRPDLKAVRTLPVRCMAGSTVPFVIQVTNTSRRTQHDLSAFEFRLDRRLQIEPEPRYVAALEPGENHRFDYRLKATRRGSYVFHGPTALSAFPFALTHAKRHQPDLRHLIVYPNFKPLQGIQLLAGQRYQSGGLVRAGRIGDAMEFIGNREYRPGDRLRDLHHRSWARVGAPVVKQFELEFMTRVAMIVDTQVSIWRYRAFEANLSLAASVADYLSRQDFLVDLFAAGPELYHFRSAQGESYLDNILDILACLRRSRTDPLAEIAPRVGRHLSQMSAAIVLLLNWNPARAAFIDRLRSCGAEVHVVVVEDRPGPAEEARKAGQLVLSPAEIAAGVQTL